MKSQVLSVLAMFLLIGCSPQELPGNDPYANIENLKVIAETSDADLLSIDSTNWIPGDCFPVAYGYDQFDYVIFPQKGEISLNPFYIKCWMIPEQYQSFSGIAPERSFLIHISPEDISYSHNGKTLSINAKHTQAKVVFASYYGDIVIPNEQDVIISLSGEMKEKTTTEGIIFHEGEIAVTFVTEKPNKQNHTIKFTELTYYN